MTAKPNNIRTCSIDGCGRKHLGLGYCSAHYMRFKRHGEALAGGSLRAQDGEALAFLLDAIETKTNNCILWPYATSADGYGSVYYEGKVHRAHRLALTLITREEPYGMEACHTPKICHNRECVNPRHLRWATRAENMADKNIDGTVPDFRGENHPQSKLTELQVIDIYRRAHAGEVQRVIAEKYGVTRKAVSSIKLGGSWCHVTAALPR